MIYVIAVCKYNKIEYKKSLQSFSKQIKVTRQKYLYYKRSKHTLVNVSIRIHPTINTKNAAYKILSK